MVWHTLLGRGRSITHQALVRLSLSLSLLVLLLAVTTAQIYQRALDGAAKERVERLAGFYQSRIQQWEQEIEQDAHDLRIRIEHERALEHPTDASVRLQALLTIFGHSRRYNHMVIIDAAGKGIFSFGKRSDDIPVNWPRLSQGGSTWHYAAASGRLYRVWAEAIWLGASAGPSGGKGWMLAFYALDNTLMGQFAMPDVDVFAFHRGVRVAGSRDQIPKAAEPILLNWNNDPQDPVSLHAHARFKPLFSSGELVFGVAVVPLLDAVFLWFALGVWLVRQTRRIRALGDAVQACAPDCTSSSSAVAHLNLAKNPDRDELHELATALETMLEQRCAHEREIQRALGMFQSVVEGTPVAMLLVDRNGSIVMANSAAEHLFGRARSHMIGDVVESLLPHGQREAHQGVRSDYAANPTQRTMASVREAKALLADGSELEVEIGLTPIESGEGPMVLASIVDISLYKRTQAIIGSALREKTTLLNEIHHRVKNNLQVVASLLNLQAGQVNDPRYEQLLADSVQRVQAMALVHQLLYEGQDFSRIHLGEYLTRLAQLLAGMNGAQARGIALRINVEDLHLDLSRAVPCGLIVNEILSNSFKHAFPGQTGEIRLSLGHEANGDGVLRVADNGRGLPADFDPENCNTLGVQLIRTLSEQMDARLNITGAAGACYELRFRPMPPSLPGDSNEGGAPCQASES